MTKYERLRELLRDHVEGGERMVKDALDCSDWEEARNLHIENATFKFVYDSLCGIVDREFEE